MKSLFSQLAFIAILAMFLVGCNDSDREPVKASINFSFGSAPGSAGGRISETKTPASVIVTLHDKDGNVIKNHIKLGVNVFAAGYISETVLLDVTGDPDFYLSEFFILDANDAVIYASPKEGSALAHLVNNPLDIVFKVAANQLTTVNPEVLPVEDTSPTDFGYANFGFSVTEKIEVVVSAFVPAGSSFGLTDAHLKVEGLQDSTSTSPAVLWSYETELFAKANIVALKKAPAYRITITKDGFNTWEKIRGLKPLGNVNAFLTEGNTSDVDVFLAGNISHSSLNYVAMYIKNGEVVILDNETKSAASDIAIHNNDVYTTGYRTQDLEGYYFHKAGYWKNTERIDLPFYGITRRVVFSGNDFYMCGYSMPGPHYVETRTGFFMKNGVKTNIPPFTTDGSVFINDMYVDGNDVYLVGYEEIGAVKNYLFWKNTTVSKLPSTFNPVAVTVKNGHVYIAGNSNKKVSLMKDEVITTLSTKEDARDVIVTDNEDVYVLGRTGYYWRNGEQIALTNVSGLPQDSWAFTILEDKVYAAGDGYKPISTGSGLEARSYYWIGDEVVWGPKGVLTTSMVVQKKKP